MEDIGTTLGDSPSSPALLPGEKGAEPIDVKLKNLNPTHVPLSLGRGARGEDEAVDLTEFSKVTGRLRKIPEGLIVRARELREKQTPSEEILWECLRDRRLLNAKFRRQHNVGPYIADFYCHMARLVVELDGGIHLTQQVKDENRDEWMQSQGLTVLRFTNEVVQKQLEEVLATIGSTLGNSPSSPALLPEGEGSRTKKKKQQKP